MHSSCQLSKHFFVRKVASAGNKSLSGDITIHKLVHERHYILNIYPGINAAGVVWKLFVHHFYQCRRAGIPIALTQYNTRIDNYRIQSLACATPYFQLSPVLTIGINRVVASFLPLFFFCDRFALFAAAPTYFTAIVAGLLSFLSPCVLPLVPAYLGYLSGHTFQRG